MLNYGNGNEVFLATSLLNSYLLSESEWVVHREG